MAQEGRRDQMASQSTKIRTGTLVWPGRRARALSSTTPTRPMQNASLRIGSLLPFLLALGACAGTPTATDAGAGTAAIVEANATVREPLFAAIAALEGTWVADNGATDTETFVFEVSSAGTVVRERMNAGSDHEMTNLYALDGNGIAMTHYCAGGNQPRMRATAMDGNQLAFEFQRVDDLEGTDEPYMGEMTLVFVDEDHVEQHWSALRADGEDSNHSIVIKLTRR